MKRIMRKEYWTGQFVLKKNLIGIFKQGEKPKKAKRWNFEKNRFWQNQKLLLSSYSRINIDKNK